MATSHHRIVIVGGGTAGIATAARLTRAGQRGIAIIEPSPTHYYQPMWTLVGAGLAQPGPTARREAGLIPKGVHWIKAAAATFDPAAKSVGLADGSTVTYEVLIVCPGIQLDWAQVPGLADTLGSNGVSSNYSFDLAPRTWEMIRSLRKGTAVFMQPNGPIKCGGAPQKIAYLAADYWQRQGLLGDIKVVMALPSPGIFGVPEFARVLDGVVARYGIDVRFQTVVSEIRPDAREVVLHDAATDTTSTLGYDFLHAVPPQSAPDWIKSSPLAVPGDPKGWVDIDRHTLQHVRYPDIFALGDAGSSPNSKTGAAIRKQAPVVAQNVIDHLAGRSVTRHYDGYSSCPIVTAHNRMLLCEFDYTGRPHPTVPLIDTKKERFDMYLLKRYGLPQLYWNLMMRGYAMSTPKPAAA